MTSLPDDSDRVLRIAETVKLTGLSEPQLRRMEEADLFPRRFKLSPASGLFGAAGHSFVEVQAWLQARRQSRERVA